MDSELFFSIPVRARTRSFSLFALFAHFNHLSIRAHFSTLASSLDRRE
jgi:hypothetical protein